MKAVVIEQFGDPEVLSLREVVKPIPKNDEVLIKILKTSVNFADIKARRGKKNGKLPIVLGLDAVGIVEQVGEQVTDLKVGERVIAFPKNGSYAEYALASSTLTFRIPDSLDLSSAAASPIVSFLSYHLLKSVARIQPGEDVLIHSGSGGVGTVAIQLAKYFGARKVFSTVGNLKKKDFVLKAGADDVFLYDQFDQKINDRTNNQGVDIILDSVAGNITRQSINCLKKFGRLVQYGNSSGEPGVIKTNDVHSSCRSILGFSLGTTRKEKPELLKKISNHVIDLINAGQIIPHIGAEFDLATIKQAHQLMESRTHTGKIVINVSTHVQ
ncbi:MAG: zinc-binding dehydrogenase [Shouchella clausii]|jgi:NADPH:quinone reductase